MPATIRVDQGTEFVSRDLDLWAYQRGVTLDFSRPGKPTDNAYIEAFNGRFRAECERPLVPEPCRRPRKDGGLAQVLQRRTPPWGDRPKDADYAAESRWRIQPATVSKPENSSLRRSKDRSQSKKPENSTLRRSKDGSQSTENPALSHFVAGNGVVHHINYCKWSPPRCRRTSVGGTVWCRAGSACGSKANSIFKFPPFASHCSGNLICYARMVPQQYQSICPLPLIDATKCPAARKSTKRYRQSCASRRRSPARTRGRRRSCHPSRCDLQEHASRPA